MVEEQEKVETKPGFSLKIETKVKKYISCKGKLPAGKSCNKLLYQTDGEFMYDVNGSILNKGKGKQKIECARCGSVAFWTRNPKYVDSSPPLRR